MHLKRLPPYPNLNISIVSPNRTDISSLIYSSFIFVLYPFFISCLYLSLLHERSKPTRKGTVNFKRGDSCLNRDGVSFPFPERELPHYSVWAVKHRSQNSVGASGNLFCSNAFARVHRCKWNFYRVPDSPVNFHWGTRKLQSTICSRYIDLNIVILWSNNTRDNKFKHKSKTVSVRGRGGL
jgi:hypothetical protein